MSRMATLYRRDLGEIEMRIVLFSSFIDGSFFCNFL